VIILGQGRRHKRNIHVLRKYIKTTERTTRVVNGVSVDLEIAPCRLSFEGVRRSTDRLVTRWTRCRCSPVTVGRPPFVETFLYISGHWPGTCERARIRRQTDGEREATCVYNVVTDCRLLSWRRVLVFGRFQKYRRYRSQSVPVKNAQHHLAFLHTIPQFGGQARHITVFIHIYAVCSSPE